jgi:peroxiredoxin
MAATESTMLPLGTRAPDFTLSDPRGGNVSLSEYAGAPAVLVVFMCNHCPFVKLIDEALLQVVSDYADKGFKAIAINSNDVANYPDDSPEKMTLQAMKMGYTFPYLFDESQEVAKAYRAACTPDFFLFDAELKLSYRGQFDSSRPGNGKVPNGEDLRAAIGAVLQGNAIPSNEQKPSIGCNIKWKPGNEPDYFRR